MNLVIKEIIDLNIKTLLMESLPKLPQQSQYNWFDIFMSYWSVFFSGGDCAEDLSINIKNGLQTNPYVKIPSPDRILSRVKFLSDIPQFFVTKRGKKEHQFSLAEKMNRLNLEILKLLPDFQTEKVVLDYDNTVIFTEKSDAKMTYHRESGYYPGVGMIGKHIVYVENRNGNSSAHVMQHETIDRMSSLMQANCITVDAIRADSASYGYEIIQSMAKAAKRIFVKARMTHTVEKAISEIKEWKEINIGEESLLRGSTTFVPFERSVRGDIEKINSLKEYRLVVTNQARKDGQINIFTGEAYNYSAIVTNDFDMTDDEVVHFYNARGAQEREFDELKNDFGWGKMPFSRLEQNTVFLLIMAMCKNLYTHMIFKSSRMVKHLSSSFSIKKFIFRFICIPGKWVYSGRQTKLRLYGKISFKT